MNTCAVGSAEGVGRNAALMESELKMRSLIYHTLWPQPILLSTIRGALVASGNRRVLKFRKLLGKPQAQTCTPQGF